MPGILQVLLRNSVHLPGISILTYCTFTCIHLTSIQRAVSWYPLAFPLKRGLMYRGTVFLSYVLMGD